MHDRTHHFTAVRDAALALNGLSWKWWTSNSYRRLTFEARGARDGGALCATTNPVDKWPDLDMAPGVQQFIEMASPETVLAMANRIAELEAALKEKS